MGNNALNVNSKLLSLWHFRGRRAHADVLRLIANTQNGKHVVIAITTHGSDWYWAVTAVMTCATLAFIGLSATKPRSHRLFHYITAAVTMVASIAYFSMASNLGWTPIDVEFVRTGNGVGGMNREIFYVRYIDWFITTPLLLMDLLLTAGMPWPSILYVILIDEVMVVTGLVGALVKTSYKWGYWTFGMFALFYILYVLVWEARRNASRLGKDVGTVFLMTGTLTSFLWTLYPIAWGLCEGGNLITPDSEAVFYGILDLLAKPVFGAILIFGHRNIDPARLGLLIKDYAGEDAAVSQAQHTALGNHTDSHQVHGDKKIESSNGHSNGTNGAATTETTV